MHVLLSKTLLLVSYLAPCRNKTTEDIDKIITSKYVPPSSSSVPYDLSSTKHTSAKRIVLGKFAESFSFQKRFHPQLEAKCARQRTLSTTGRKWASSAGGSGFLRDSKPDTTRDVIFDIDTTTMNSRLLIPRWLPPHAFKERSQLCEQTGGQRVSHDRHMFTLQTAQ